MKTEIKKKRISQVEVTIYDSSTVQKKSPIPKVLAREFLTPLFQGKLKTMAKSIKQAKNEKFKITMINNQEHIVPRSELKIISQPVKIKIPSILLRDDLTIRDIQLLNVVMKKKVDEQVFRNSKIKKKILQTSKSLQEKKRKLNQNLGKIKKIKMRLKNIPVLLTYNLLIKQKLQDYEQRIQNKQAQIKKVIQQMDKISKMKMKISASILQISQNLINCKQQFNKMQILIQQQCLQKNYLSNNPLPQQRQLIETLFTIGILNEQIFINDICKRNKYLDEEVEDNQKMKRTKQNKDQNDRKINKEQFEQEFNIRQLVIYKQETESLIFKLITYVYMHVRTIQLNNARITMNRISYFQQEFRHIFDYNYYEKCINILIERMKNNQTNVKVLKQKNQQQSQNSNIKGKKLVLVVDRNYYDFIKWIMQTFEQNDSNYYLNISKIKSIVELKSNEQYVKCDGEENEAMTLKLIFQQRIVYDKNQIF